MQEVVEAISPTEEERRELLEASKGLKRKLESLAREHDPRLYIRHLGSSARDTWLRYEKDLDLFLFFPLGYSKGEMEKVVEGVGNKFFSSPQKHYAEHPYIRGEYKGYTVELVPCYALSSPRRRMSAVDRTPFHHRYVRERVKGKEEEVRLLKQFMKGIGAYGAEARVKGFSGYLCELLIIRFKSFEGTLKKAQNFRFGERISLQGEKMKSKKFRSHPLVFIDPVDENRNVASALSEENLALLIHASRSYLNNKSKRSFFKFFFPGEREEGREEVKRYFSSRGSEILGLQFPPPEVVEDILYPQVEKALKNLSTHLALHGFQVLGRDYHVEEERVALLFEIQSLSLPWAKHHPGPEVGSGKNEERFLRKHREEPYSASSTSLCRPFIEGKRWAVYAKRKFNHARECLEAGLCKGMPRHVASSLEKNYTILENEEVMEKFSKGFLAQYLYPLFPWEY